MPSIIIAITIAMKYYIIKERKWPMDGNFNLQNKKATKILIAMLIIASMKWASTSPTNILLVFTPKKIQAFYAFIFKGIAYPHWERN